MQITNSYRTNLAYVHGQVINSSKSPAGSAVVPNLDGSHYACDSEETQVPQDHKVFSWRTVKSRTTCRRQDLIPNVELWKSLDQPSISHATLKLFDNHLHWTVLIRPWNSSSAAMSEMTVRQGSDVKPHWKNWLLSEEKKVQVLIWASPMTNNRHPRCVPGIASGQAAG